MSHFAFTGISLIEKSVRSLLILALILLVRKKLNLKSTHWANLSLWLLLVVYLLCPKKLVFYVNAYEDAGLFKTFIIFINQKLNDLATIYDKVFFRLNRIIVSLLLLFYMLLKIKNRNGALSGSKLVMKDERIAEILNLFGLKRNVDIYINDDLSSPLTCGVIRPKIIIQSSVLQNDKLLKYVLIHELNHIKNFDIVLTHIFNLIKLLYWHNIFILLFNRRFESDVEIHCDKLVIEKVGDTRENRKEYCQTMLQLSQPKAAEPGFALKLHPTIERMKIMQKWQKTLKGMLILILTVVISAPVFVGVEAYDENKEIIFRPLPSII